MKTIREELIKRGWEDCGGEDLHHPEFGTVYFGNKFNLNMFIEQVFENGKIARSKEIKSLLETDE